MIRLSAIGWRARAALDAAGGVVQVVATLTDSTYVEASGELIWLGPTESALHPRAMLAAALPPGGPTAIVETNCPEPWRPPPVALLDTARLAPEAMRLIAALRRHGWTEAQPAGLAALLVGQTLGFPLDRSRDAVDAVAHACGRNAPGELEAAAIPLLGLGPGLTPSGDDFAGGVLFARAILNCGDSGWAVAAARLVAAARRRTHPISAALLADLAAGEGHEPLHDLVAALAAGAPDGARRAVNRLARLGHSSGWDMLTGLLVGLAGPAALAPSRP